MPNLIEPDKLQELRASGKDVVVDFYADWCRPCHALAPEIEALAERYADVEVVKIDIEAHPEIAQEHGVMSIPTVVRFGSDGTEASRSVGLMQADQLAERLGLDAA